MNKTKAIVIDLEQRRQGRAQLLERLFNGHQADLRAFLVARLGVDEEKGLDDVIQGVFLRLAKVERLPDEVFQGGQKGVSYLLAVAHHLVIDRERAEMRRRRFLEREAREQQSDESFSDLNPERSAIATERLEKLKDVISAMRPGWRRAFVLSRLKFMSYEEIARDMGISIKQVEKHMKNALACIRRAAQEMEADDESEQA